MLLLLLLMYLWLVVCLLLCGSAVPATHLTCFAPSLSAICATICACADCTVLGVLLSQALRRDHVIMTARRDDSDSTFSMGNEKDELEADTQPFPHGAEPVEAEPTELYDEAQQGCQPESPAIPRGSSFSSMKRSIDSIDESIGPETDAQHFKRSKSSKRRHTSRRSASSPPALAQSDASGGAGGAHGALLPVSKSAHIMRALQNKPRVLKKSISAPASLGPVLYKCDECAYVAIKYSNQGPSAMSALTFIGFMVAPECEVCGTNSFMNVWQW